MHTEHLHRTLSPQAYAHLQDTLRRQAEAEHRLAVQTGFQAGFQVLRRQLVQLAQRARHTFTRPQPMKA